jgi:hypothetical protein
MVAKIPKPKFSGHESDWKEFSRAWHQWFAMLKCGGNDPGGDAVLLELLRDSLDMASQNQLVAMRAADQGLTYATFWRELEREFGRDLSAHHRKEWERVTLGGVQRLTPFAFRSFIAEFKLK